MCLAIVLIWLLVDCILTIGETHDRVMSVCTGDIWSIDGLSFTMFLDFFRTGGVNPRVCAQDRGSCLTGMMFDKGLEMI